MKPQTAFNKMVEHLRKQGKQSVNSNGACLYRGPNGLKCAVGCLIPDEDYFAQDMEHTAAFEDFHVFAGWPRETIHVMDDMRRVHDNSIAASGFPESKFQRVARDHGLTLKDKT